jgi:hypothetical protein
MTHICPRMPCMLGALQVARRSTQFFTVHSSLDDLPAFVTEMIEKAGEAPLHTARNLVSPLMIRDPIITLHDSEAVEPMAPDDIRLNNPASATEGTAGAELDRLNHSIGPESEDPGGPHAPCDSSATTLRQPADTDNASDPPKPPGQPPEIPDPDQPIPIEEPPQPIPVPPPNEPPPPIVAALRA